MSRIYRFTCLFVFLSITSCGAQDHKARAVETTDHFEFYINKWLNLHHFLFQTAKSIARDTNHTIEKFPKWDQLNRQEQKTVTELMQYYQDNWLGKDLLFNQDLYQIKRQTTYWGNDIEAASSESYPTLVHHWKAFYPIYDQYFWTEHLAQNQKILQENLDRIKSFEPAATKRLSQLSQEPWPAEKIRVDITYIANWAGAYTTTKPVHIVTSTHREGPEGDWIETLFHEASHKLIGGRRGAVSEMIQKVAAEEEFKIPRQLWHGVLFYFAGKTTQDLLATQGVAYDLFMLRENVFDDYYPALQAAMNPYLEGKHDLEAAIKELLISLQ